MDDVLNLRGLYFGKADQSVEEDAKAKIVEEIFARDDQKKAKKAGSDSKDAKGKKLKVLGEDIMAGKVTMPVAKAMSRMNKADRQKLWDTVSSKPQDTTIVNNVIADLEKVGAIDACVEQANSIVEDAWAKLDPIVPDSFAKMMLRSFGWFVVRR
jgi:geranylgeranyl pyrophosphate synthase